MGHPHHIEFGPREMMRKKEEENMKRRIAGTVFLVAALLWMAQAAAFAQGAAPASVAPGEEVKAVAVAQLKLMGKNIVLIANAMPADKYTWNPGITRAPPPSAKENDDNYGRPFANLLLHIANLNFGRPPLMGVAPAAGYDAKGYETSTTDKAKIVEQLTLAFAYAQNAAEKLTAADLSKSYTVGKNDTTGNAIVAQWMENINDYFGQ